MTAALEMCFTGPYSTFGLNPKNSVYRMKHLQHSIDIFGAPRIDDIDVIGLNRSTLQHRG